MIIIINGPLGAGKSSLGEALSESIERCVFLDGDHIVAANPEPDDPPKLLHSSIAMLVSHFRDHGYRHFVICHYWQTPDAMADLRNHLLKACADTRMRVFLTWLPLEENLARIRKRQASRAIDELVHDLETVRIERRELSRWPEGDIGERIDVSAPVPDLVEELLESLQKELGGDYEVEDRKD